MSRPEQRTALREADRRETSPSSARIVVAVSGPIAVLAHQRLTARLVTREASELALERDQLAVDLVDDRQRDLDPLRGRGRQLERAQERAPVGPQQLVGDVGDAVVKQRRLDPLHPTGALVDQRLAQARPGPPLAHVRRRDPRLRQPPLTQQRPQPARVRAIGLGVALLAAQRARLRRLGQVRDRTRRRQRLAHEQPPVHASTATSTCSPAKPDPRADRLPISANPSTVTPRPSRCPAHRT